MNRFDGSLVADITEFKAAPGRESWCRWCFELRLRNLVACGGVVRFSGLLGLCDGRY